MATIAFDFDGVIATYDGWKGPDVFGEPIFYTIDLMDSLKVRGDRVIIWTTRKVTTELLQWLKKYNVVYDTINDNSHNPPDTSEKPIFDVFIDDRAIGFKPGIDLLKEINIILQGKRPKIEPRG